MGERLQLTNALAILIYCAYLASTRTQRNNKSSNWSSQETLKSIPFCNRDATLPEVRGRGGALQLYSSTLFSCLFCCSCMGVLAPCYRLLQLIVLIIVVAFATSAMMNRRTTRCVSIKLTPCGFQFLFQIPPVFSLAMAYFVTFAGHARTKWLSSALLQKC